MKISHRSLEAIRRNPTLIFELGKGQRGSNSIARNWEYHPFGTTSYRSGRTETETSPKRYKYVGKERDEELRSNRRTPLKMGSCEANWTCIIMVSDIMRHGCADL